MDYILHVHHTLKTIESCSSTLKQNMAVVFCDLLCVVFRRHVFASELPRGSSLARGARGELPL